MGQIFSNYVNRCIAFWTPQIASSFSNVLNSPQTKKNTGFEISVFNYANGTYLNVQKKGGKINLKKNPEWDVDDGITDECLVIMGFNPAGTITKAFPSCHTIVSNHSPLSLSARNINNIDIVNIYNPYVVNPIQDPYTKAIDDFAKQCGYGDNYAKIDAFGILQSTQKTLENDIVNNPANYVGVLNLSISAIINMAPKAVVFANAGLRRLIINNKLFGNMVVLKNWNKQKCAWEIELNDGQRTHKCWGVFTTMLSGGHLDNGSKEVIAQVVANL